MRYSFNKEVAVGKHYLCFGYELRSLSYAITISKYGIDINFYPFFIGIEFHGVTLDKKFEQLIQYKITQ